MALPVPFDPQGFPIVNAITWDGGAVGPGVPLELPPQNITQVTTDAGSFAGNFPGASLYRAINGGLTLTTGSTAWARANVVTALRVGDYVEIIADHNDAVPVMAQIATIANDGLSGTLQAAYAGAGGVLAAAQVSDWYVRIAGAGAAIAVAAGAATLSPALANPARITLARYMGPGGRKGCAPLWSRFILRQDVRRVGQMTSFGLASNLDTALGIVSAAGFNLSGILLDTQVVLVGSRNTPMGIVDLDGDVVPGGGSTADAQGHLFETLLLEDQIKWYIDAQEVGTGMPGDYAGQGEIPDPYTGMFLFLQIENTGVPAGATNLVVRDAHCKSLDVVDVRPVQPDGSKLHVTVDQMPLVPLNADLQGQIESLPAPNPASIRAAEADLALIAEPDHALRTRARVLTDEGLFYDDFPGAALARAIAGNVTLTSGTTAWSRAAATTVLRVGDYIYLNADTYTYATQIDTINPGALSGTLRAAYPAAGGGTGAASVANWRQTIVDGAAAGSTITVVGSEVVLTQAGLANNDALSIARQLGAGGFKPSLPVRIGFAARQDVRRANQTTVFGVFDAPTIATATAGTLVQFEGSDANTVIRIASQSSAGIVSEQQITLPAYAHTDNESGFELIVRPDRVSFYDAIGNRLGVAPIHLLDPYAPLYLFVCIFNTGVTAGATIVRVNHALVLDVNEVEADVFQSDPSKLLASVRDIQPFTTGVPPAAHNIADNLVHEITAAAGTGMEIGKHYCVTQIGGADIQIYTTSAGAPAIATLRRSPFHLFSGIPWVFSPTVNGERIYAGKAVDGTANADVYVAASDGGSAV